MNGELAKDLEQLARQARGRRRALRLLMAGGAGASGLLSTPLAAAAQALCTPAPKETAGPFPANGTNSRRGTPVNALTHDGIVRSDIRPSFAGRAGVAAGVPLELTLTLVDARGCSPLAAHAVYVWQADQ